MDADHAFLTTLLNGIALHPDKVAIQRATDERGILFRINTHSKASLHEAFPAAEARRLVERFEWRYTPKHGSWLNLAESELGVLAAQCPDRRIPNKQILKNEIAAWDHDRNTHHTKSDWQFTTKDARVKLKTPIPINLAKSGD